MSSSHTTARPRLSLLAARQRLRVVTPRPGIGDGQPTPRLVVFISIDQMRGDYITRYGSHWTRGLRRLVDEGALFVQSAYPYFNTVTCAGHATMGTGTFPSTHGMVLNAWYDRASKKSVTCTDDASVSLVTYGSGPAAAAGAGPQAAAVKPPAPAPSHGAATPGPVSGRGGGRGAGRPQRAAAAHEHLRR